MGKGSKILLFILLFFFSFLNNSNAGLWCADGDYGRFINGSPNYCGTDDTAKTYTTNNAVAKTILTNLGVFSLKCPNSSYSRYSHCATLNQVAGICSSTGETGYNINQNTVDCIAFLNCMICQDYACNTLGIVMGNNTTYSSNALITNPAVECGYATNIEGNGDTYPGLSVSSAAGCKAGTYYNSGKCYNCATGYTSVAGCTGNSTTSGCCTSLSSCTTNVGEVIVGLTYRKNILTSPQHCVKRIDNCVGYINTSISSASECIECETNYTLSSANNTNSCVGFHNCLDSGGSISIFHVYGCTCPSTAKKINGSGSINENIVGASTDHCVLSINDCVTYNTTSTHTASTCTTCSNGKTPTYSGKLCVANNITSCVIYNDVGDCTSCNTDMLLLAADYSVLTPNATPSDNTILGKYCIARTYEVNGCVKYDGLVTSSSKCLVCASGKIPSVSGRACVTPNIANCDNSYNDNGLCVACSSTATPFDASFNMITTSTYDANYCMSTSNLISACKTYTDANFNKCSACVNSDYALSSDQSGCVTAVAGCQSGKLNNDGTCSECQSNYTGLDESYHVMSPSTSSGAKYCVMGLPSGCSGGYYLPNNSAWVCNNCNAKIPVQIATPFNINVTSQNTCVDRHILSCNSFSNNNYDFCDRCDGTMLLLDDVYNVLSQQQGDTNISNSLGKYCVSDTNYVSDCKSYNNTNLDKCLSCNSNKIPSSSGRFCVNGGINNCANDGYNENNTCNKCNTGFTPFNDVTIITGATVGAYSATSCQQNTMLIENCDTYTNNSFNVCYNCALDYTGFKESGGSYIRPNSHDYTQCKLSSSLIDNCVKYTNNSLNTCAECDANSITPNLTADGKKCVETNIPSCRTYNANNTCYECNDLYAPFDTNYSILPSTSHNISYCVDRASLLVGCNTYNNNTFTQCISCANNYHISQLTGISCLLDIDNCSTFNDTNGTCRACAPNYFTSYMDENNNPVMTNIDATFCYAVHLNRTAGKSLAESNLASLIALNQLADLITIDAMSTALGVMENNKCGVNGGDYCSINSAISMFGLTNGGASKYRTGSSITSTTFNSIYGLVFNLGAISPRTMFGIFGNWGMGTYITDNDGFSGNGNVNMKGVGGFLHKLFANDYFLQLSAFGGVIENEYSSPNLFLTNYDEMMCSNNLYNTTNLNCAVAKEYANNSRYYGGHIGVGKIFEFKKDGNSVLDKIELSIKYLFGKVEGNSVVLNNGDTVIFDDVRSDRFRIGAKWTTNLISDNSGYDNRGKKVGKNFLVDYVLGLDLEYELNGKQRATVTGKRNSNEYFSFDTDEPTTKGYSIIVSNGLNFSMDDKFNVNLSITNRFGNKNIGTSGTLGMKYMFGTDDKYFEEQMKKYYLNRDVTPYKCYIKLPTKKIKSMVVNSKVGDSTNDDIAVWQNISGYNKDDGWCYLINGKEDISTY